MRWRPVAHCSYRPGFTLTPVTESLTAGGQIRSKYNSSIFWLQKEKVFRSCRTAIDIDEAHYHNWSYKGHCTLVFESKISPKELCINIRRTKIRSKFVLLLYSVLVIILFEPLEHHDTATENRNIFFPVLQIEWWRSFRNFRKHQQDCGAICDRRDSKVSRIFHSLWNSNRKERIKGQECSACGYCLYRF
jgi:hypothetical protein